MKVRILNLSLCAAVFVAGCAGRKAYPVETYAAGDEKRTCHTLFKEMAECKNKMDELRPHVNKFWTNLFWFLWFTPLMDLKEAERIEYDAFERRRNHLSALATDKNCDPNELFRGVTGYRAVKDLETGQYIVTPVFEDQVD
jgi:hypothetical protein